MTPMRRRNMLLSRSEGLATDISWITYSKWNRSHSASSYHEFQTKLLKERPLGGFNVAWGRGNSSRKAE
jgi:hypothetical protein